MCRLPKATRGCQKATFDLHKHALQAAGTQARAAVPECEIGHHGVLTVPIATRMFDDLGNEPFVASEKDS